MLVLMLTTLTSFAFGDSHQYYQNAVNQANGLPSTVQREAIQSMTPDQAAGLSYAGSSDIAAAVPDYHEADFFAQAAPPTGATYQDPSVNDPTPVLANIQQNENADLGRSPANDPNLIQDTRNFSLQNLQNKGAGGFISAAQRMDQNLDRSKDPTNSYQVMRNTLQDGNYGVMAQ